MIQIQVILNMHIHDWQYNMQHNDWNKLRLSIKAWQEYDKLKCTNNKTSHDTIIFLSGKPWWGRKTPQTCFSLI